MGRKRFIWVFGHLGGFTIPLNPNIVNPNIVGPLQERPIKRQLLWRIDSFRRPLQSKACGEISLWWFFSFHMSSKGLRMFQTSTGAKLRLDLRSFRFVQAVNMSNRALLQGNKYWQPDKQLARLTSSWRVACVASVSNRVIARKLKREEKKKRSTNSRGNTCNAG